MTHQIQKTHWISVYLIVTFIFLVMFCIYTSKLYGTTDILSYTTSHCNVLCIFVIQWIVWNAHWMFSLFILKITIITGNKPNLKTSHWSLIMFAVVLTYYCWLLMHLHSSIHPFSTIHLRLVHRGNRSSSELQTSFQALTGGFWCVPKACWWDNLST